MFFSCSVSKAQDSETTSLLSTLDDGAWLCAYYMLNSNEELGLLSSDEWAGHCVDEEEWVQGYGPLSNSPDQFLTTEWGSQVQPLLVRRHFSLTEEQLTELMNKTVVLTCSYDENPHVYLNGSLIWSASGWNDNDYARYPLIPRHKKLLTVGDNVLAVSLQQGDGGGHIDYGLYFLGSFSASSVDASECAFQESRYFNLAGQSVSVPRDKGVYIQHDGFKTKKIIKR